MNHIQAKGNAIQIIGSETGHTVQNVAFCDTAERAISIVKGIKDRDGLIKALRWIADSADIAHRDNIKRVAEDAIAG